MSAGDELRDFHVMAKPTGSRCNLACDYCFFLKKEHLYPGSEFRMSDEVMESYIRQTFEAHQAPEATIAWQGGEPTLMGLDFFRRAMAAERKYVRPGMRIENTLQTNGVLLDDQWCRFLHDNNFLVGLSLDGPRLRHDAYRHDKAGHSVFDQVIQAVRLMQKHKVEFNILCTVSAANSLYPLEVYRFFRDELKTPYLQFIPIVERANESGFQEGQAVTERSVRPEQYGRFLIEIFDEWIKRDVGRMFVQTFDGVLASWLLGGSSLCIFQPTCGRSVTLEHNGDVYSCDHFVEPRHLLGNIMQTPLADLVSSDKQQEFGQAKSSALPGACRQCEYLFACHGECPKNRVLATPDGEPGLNWLCAGLKAFFAHTREPMKVMADLLRQGRLAEEVMKVPENEKKAGFPYAARAGRNEPCSCGSGLKFKKCHGRG
ncbi:MAG: anaerobic sulfatase maturase [Sedimentisphaerales bacterium]|nr:anaerobic sulfatase maturase [Sedimentisphaerales bacterium]